MEQFKILVTGIQRFSIFNFKRSCLISNREKGVRLLTVPANQQHSSCGLRILFFGTDSFALESLKQLHHGCEDPSSVITKLEVCCAKNKNLVPDVAKYSKQNRLNLHEWPPNLETGEFDLGVVASFGHLIPSKIINKFPLGMINVHGSILPQLRGAAPIIHALKNGHTSTGVTIMKIKPKKFDIGDILVTDELSIEPEETRPQLTQKMAQKGSELLLKVVTNFTYYDSLKVSQLNLEASYAPAIDKSIAFIDFTNQSNHDVYNLWRAVGDLMKLRCRWKPTDTTTRIAVIHPPALISDLDLDTAHPEATPGYTTFIKRRGKGHKHLCVRCRSGWVAVDMLTYDKRKAMRAQDFANGFLKNEKYPYFVADS